AENDAPLGGNDIRGVRLDRRRIVELARDGTRLPTEQVLADDGLVWLQLVPRQLAESFGERTDAVEAEVRLDAVEPAQRERDVRQARVAGALSHAVDRPVDPPRASARSRHRGRSSHGDVGVGVEVNRGRW